MLTLIELQRKKVEAKRKKYEKEEMDAYLDLVYQNYKELLEENKKLEAEKAELNQKMKKLSDGIQYYHSIESTLQKALILAEKTSKETKDAAILKAEAIEKDANKKAEEIVRNAEGEYKKIKGKCLQLVQQFNQYKLQLIEAASAQLQLVEGDEFDISNPDEFEKTLDIPVRKEPRKQPAASTGQAKNVQPKPSASMPSGGNKQPEAPKTAAPRQDASGTTAAAVEPAAQQKRQEPARKMTREEILNADTIDLRSTLKKVQTEAEGGTAKPDTISQEAVKPRKEQPVAEVITPKKAVTETISSVSTSKPAASAEEENSKLTMPEEPEGPLITDDRLEVGKASSTKEATVLEPIPAQPLEPMDLMFEDEIAANAERSKEKIEPKEAEKAAESVPTLDSLLQDLNINNQSQKSDDPFEFLGSVDF